MTDNEIRQAFAAIRAEEAAADAIAAQADAYALAEQGIVMLRSELDPAACPPDRRICRDDREAWVYHHGKVTELVFVVDA